MRIKFNYPHIPPRAKVGETVYYSSPVNRFAIKRSVVVEIRDERTNYEQVMKNGDIVLKDPRKRDDFTTFPTLEAALNHIQTILIRRINRRQTSIETILREQAAEKRILQTMIKQHPDIEPGCLYLKQKDSSNYFFNKRHDNQH